MNNVTLTMAITWPPGDVQCGHGGVSSTQHRQWMAAWPPDDISAATSLHRVQSAAWLHLI